jgi:hypothetical protein
MVVLTGFAGLGIDMGVMRYQKRLQQTAADAAALAGASNLAAGTGGIVAGAQAASGGDGYADTTGGGACVTPPTNLDIGAVTVTVCNGPSTGPHIGNAKYVEVFVSAGHPTYFMNLLNIPKETITARAVATYVSGGGPNSGCLYTLGSPSSSIEGININGSATLNAPTCGIVDNGNFNTAGNKLVVNADSFGVAGDWQKSGPGGTVTCSPTAPACPTIDMPATGNPMASLSPPSQPGPSPSCPASGNCNFSSSGPGNQTIQPGSYSTITISNNSNVTFSPGIYYINGSAGMAVNGNATITGTGVMFYFTGDATINMTGTPTVNLTAPTASNCAACPSQYDGILMYQDPADPNVGPHPNGPNIGGNAGSTYNGALYFPSDQVTFFGNSNTNACGSGISVGMVVSDSLALSGHPTVCMTGPSGLGGGGITVNAIKNAVLVE